MFRHIVLLTFDDATSPADVDAIVEGLETLPGSIPELRRYVFGRDARINDGNADLGVVADFDDVDGYLVYRDHPAHRTVNSERIAPHLAARSAIQIEVAD